MRKCIKLLLVLIIASFFGLISTKQTQAASAVKMSDKNLVISSDAIITGKVIYIESRKDSNSGDIYTDITIALNQTIKGNLKTDTLVIEQLGGQVGNKQIWLTGSPEFSVGEEVLLFLKANDQGVLHTNQLSLGKFSITEQTANRTIKGANLSNRVNPYDANKFIENIKQLVLDNPQTTSGVELKAVPKGYSPGSGRRLDNFTLTTSRFFAPDNAGTVTFFVNSTAAPVSGGANTEVNNAITAWNNSGSRLKLVNGGASTVCGAKMDGKSTISFNGCDPNAVLDPPMDGQGMLSTVMVAVGTDDFRLINGIKFSPIIESDIVYNNAFNNVLSVSKDLEELIAHDLGIAFGLDNSSTDPNEADPVLSQAIMYFQPHLDKRGARLNTDDQTAVNRIYPFITPVQLNAITLPTPTVNVAYAAQVTATAGQPPFTFAITKGSLPTGLNFSAMGQITGTPTKIESQTFEVTVVDQANFKSSQMFSLSTTALAPRITSVSPTRIAYNGISMITIKGFNFTTVTAVNVSKGTVQAFKATDDNTIIFGLTGPGTTGQLTDITVVNPGGTVTMPSVILYDGPMLKSAMVGRVMVRNKKGKLISANSIIVKGDGLTLNQQIRIDGTPANLTPGRSTNGDIVYYGSVAKQLPKKGDFNITIFDAGLTSESNPVKGQRAQ